MSFSKKASDCYADGGGGMPTAALMDETVSYQDEANRFGCRRKSFIGPFWSMALSASGFVPRL